MAPHGTDQRASPHWHRVQLGAPSGTRAWLSINAVEEPACFIVAVAVGDLFVAQSVLSPLRRFAQQADCRAGADDFGDCYLCALLLGGAGNRY